MKKIVIESTETKDSNFPKKGADGRWYKRLQPVLLFDPASKYPDKGFITLAFSDDPKKIEVSAIPIGEYQLSQDCLYFDRSGEIKSSIKPEHLEIIKPVRAA